ncbi:MAG: hypothetical protein AAGC55_17585, partial [Myxococcota bacterium]
GQVRFGMNKEDVRLILGQPFRMRPGTDEHDLWEYRHLGAVCEFTAGDGGVLNSLVCTSTALLLFGSPPIDLSDAQLRTLGTIGILPELAVTEEQPYLTATIYTCAPLGLSFWVRGGVVQKMTIHRCPCK